MNKTPAISVQNLDIGYRMGTGNTHTVHRAINMALHAGELTCLLGANGAGKSTLIRTLSGSQPPLSGTILINGIPLQHIRKNELSRLIGVVLTDKTSIGGLTVREVVELGRQPHTGFFGRLSPHDHNIVTESLESCGIMDKATRFIASLSDGERQKVMIAKALAQECPIVLLDEPTAFLDIVSRIEIMSLLHRIATEHDRTILLSTHDIEQALVLGDRLWLLSHNKGLETGVTEDLILSGRLDNLFPNTDIHFDPLHGCYYPTVRQEQTITVECPDETLRHWTINLLNRNGLGANINHDTAPHGPKLEIRSTQEILWIDLGQNEIFTSFEALIQFIRKNSARE